MNQIDHIKRLAYALDEMVNAVESVDGRYTLYAAATILGAIEEAKQVQRLMARHGGTLELTRLQREKEQLRAALEPFAGLSIYPDAPDDALVIVANVAGGIIDTGRNRVTVGAIREAARVYEETR